jgi:4-hydroxybenzoate polyprenyltransferase
MKINFFEKWNAEANCKEFSITRVQMILATLFAFFFVYQYFVTEGNEITVNAIVLVVMLFTFAVAPKAIKDFNDIKDKVK